MSPFEQFEVWVLNDERWELAAAFPDFELANAVARGRSTRVRLVHARYEDGKQVGADILAEIGATRTGY